ncbi:MAG: AAA family ATPase, partial [Alphaproteobacteria bacterium]
MSDAADGSPVTAAANPPQATGAPTPLSADDVGFPRYTLPPLKGGEVFAMSSHARAREALEFGLSITDSGFNVYVLGEDRSGRMTATMEYLDTVVQNRPRPADWLYLNNFRRPNEPRPISLPAGVGRKFRDRMGQLVVQLREALSRAFSGEEYQQEVNRAGEKVRAQVTERIEALRKEAKEHNVDVVQSPRGMMVVPIDAAGQPMDPEQIAEADRPQMEESARTVAEQLSTVNRWAARQQMELIDWVQEFNRQVASDAIAGTIDQLNADFQAYTGLTRWLVELREDVLDNIAIFRPDVEGAPPRPPSAMPEGRYGVNLLVDHGDEDRPKVVLEANPTYQSLFGSIEYRQVGGILDTDFTMIRAGALHKA